MEQIHKHFNDFLRHKTSNAIEFDEYLAQKMDVTKALSVNSDPDGGFLVNPEMLGLMNKRRFETSPLRQVAMIHSTMSDAIEFPIDNDETAAVWVGETQERDGVG